MKKVLQLAWARIWNGPLCWKCKVERTRDSGGACPTCYAVIQINVRNVRKMQETLRRLSYLLRCNSDQRTQDAGDLEEIGRCPIK